MSSPGNNIKDNPVSSPTVAKSSSDQAIEEFIIQSALENNNPVYSDSLVNCKRNTHRRRRKIKKNYYKQRMEINEIYLDPEDMLTRVASLQKRAVIGRWMFPDNKEVDTAVWIKQHWSPIIGYAPKVSLLINGWFSFYFMD